MNRQEATGNALLGCFMTFLIIGIVLMSLFWFNR